MIIWLYINLTSIFCLQEYVATNAFYITQVHV